MHDVTPESFPCPFSSSFIRELNIRLRQWGAGGNVGSDNTGAPDVETVQSTSRNGNWNAKIKDF